MIRVMIIDDHPILRQGIKRIFEDLATDISVVAELDGDHGILMKIKEHRVDIVILDISMPGRGGMEILKEIKASKINTSVLMLSMHSEDQYAIRAFKAGASGYLTKDKVPEKLIEAVRKVAQGRKFVSETLAEKLVAILHQKDEELPHELLSNREFQVMKMIAAGNSITGIANELSLSLKTISTHRSHILEKMKLKNNAELIHYVINHQLLD